MKKLNELFDVIYGNKLDLNKMKLASKANGGVNFVGRSSQNHGVSGTVAILEGVKPYEAGLITVALGGTKLLSSFVQEHSFYTAQNVAILIPKNEMSFAEKLFICISIRHNRFRYSAFGREANRTLRELIIPELADFPDWINDFVLDETAKRAQPAVKDQTPALEPSRWVDFRYDELFLIERGKGPRRKDLVAGKGSTPFITSTDSRNGLTGFTNDPACHDGNTIGVNRNGSVAEAFYQPKPFCSTEDVHIFTSKFPLNPHIAMFVITLIRKEKYRFNYGRKWGLERMKKSIVKLPANKSGKPDWEYMEQYIKTLPFSSQI